MESKRESLIKELERERLDFDMRAYSDALTLQIEKKRIESDS